MSRKKIIESWGRIPRAECGSLSLDWTGCKLPHLSKGVSMLPFGMGRSYGDSCLNADNVLVGTRNLNRFISFDREAGVIRCEAGVSLDEILCLVVSSGWFLPTTPGTRYVTVGGAIANDVHGKNHHLVGSFGNHVNCFELLRSDGSRRICSEFENQEWFRATIGGLGLTGLITWVEFRLRKIGSSYIDMVSTRFRNLDEFFELNTKSESQFEHTVAWVDCLAQGENLGRGIFMAGDHLQDGDFKVHSRGIAAVPIDAPNWLLGSSTVRAFNWVYYNRQLKKRKRTRVHYGPFFYPLDAVHRWNRIYGRRGFFQYQSIIPMESGEQATREMLKKIAASGQASFLAVLKTFGKIAPIGLMSFPRRGVTLALDFPNNGEATRKLFNYLDSIVLEHGGALYPAKDGRMSASIFQKFYPQFNQFEKFRDPLFDSSFWRRVTVRT